MDWDISKTPYLHFSCSSSPIRLRPLTLLGSRPMLTDARQGDAEVYLRQIQLCLDKCRDARYVRRVKAELSHPADARDYYLDRCLRDAGRLGRSLGELLTWLEETAQAPRATGAKPRRVNGR
jgi:hypothetical protein